MFGRRIGVDLGTANVLVYVRGKGIVIKEPSVVAVAQRDNSIVAVGAEARDMLGRTPGPIAVIRPMREGVIADYLTTEAMLRYFIGKVVGRFNIVKPEVMVCIPAGVTSVEQRAVRDAAEAQPALAGQPIWCPSPWPLPSALVCPWTHPEATWWWMSAAVAPRLPSYQCTVSSPVSQCEWLAIAWTMPSPPTSSVATT
jgi:hypothetical protein